jgi:hypothetical protein
MTSDVASLKCREEPRVSLRSTRATSLQLDHNAFVQTQFLIASHQRNLPTSGRVLHVEIEAALLLDFRHSRVGGNPVNSGLFDQAKALDPRLRGDDGD